RVWDIGNVTDHRLRGHHCDNLAKPFRTVSDKISSPGKLQLEVYLIHCVVEVESTGNRQRDDYARCSPGQYAIFHNFTSDNAEQPLRCSGRQISVLFPHHSLMTSSSQLPSLYSRFWAQSFCGAS